MTAPASGNYVIYNRALSSAGDKLAITWTGAIKDPLTVEKLVSNNNQIWIVNADGSKQDISPLNAPDLRTVWGDGVVAVNAAFSSWVVTGGGDEFTITDGRSTAQWGLTTDTLGEKITLEGLNGGPATEKWVFQKV